ncbi:MAG: pyrroline-5-carboxylate reductase [Verrucomicrobiales bacterium]|nr:MAG: pyrroline-5-carboxylate reductase [Verrucomicrobiaceae bacterium]
MRLGIIGCGKMGSALVKGAIKEGAITGDSVSVFDVIDSASNKLGNEIGATVTSSHDDLINKSEVVLLCVKPQDTLKMIGTLQAPDQSKLFISIAAGLQLLDLEKSLGERARVIRVMPNTPALVGKGASAFSRGTRATDDDANFVTNILGSVGKVLEVPEKQIDAITGLSGSGPAYIYTVIEALADGGVLVGLPKDKALLLAAQTVAGAAEMVIQTEEHPASLRDQVTSPGGTTIAGLAALESGKLRATLIEAVKAATLRSEDLGKS